MISCTGGQYVLKTLCCLNDSISNSTNIKILPKLYEQYNGNIRLQPCNKLCIMKIVSFGGLSTRCPRHQFDDPKCAHEDKESQIKKVIVYIRLVTPLTASL